MTIGPHTYDHHAVPQYTGEDWDTQLVAGRPRSWPRIVGHPVRLFAYPFGLWDREAFAHLDAAGYVAAFQLADKLDHRDPLWTLRRIIVPGAQRQAAAARDPQRLLSGGPDRVHGREPRRGGEPRRARVR